MPRLSRTRASAISALVVALAVGFSGLPARAGPSAASARSPTSTLRTQVRAEEVRAAASPGDFNGDGLSDAAIGAPGQSVSGHQAAGTVTVLFGTRRGLSSAGSQFLHQDVEGVPGHAELDDEFGFAVASGDFDADGFADLAVGIAHEDDQVEDTGAVIAFPGSAFGLQPLSSQLWTANTSGVPGSEGLNDQFGRALASGDFNGDGFDDLVVGAPFDDVSGHAEAGSATVLYGSASGLASAASQLWTQDAGGIADTSDAGDRLGFAVAAGDVNGDGIDDLIAGVPGEAPTDGSRRDAGAVAVILGSSQGLSSAGNQWWTQDSTGIQGTREAEDNFGYAVATGDVNGDGHADVTVGTPFEDVGSIRDAGAVSVLLGSAAGLTDAGNELWTQDSSGIAGSAEDSDELGFAVALADFDGDGIADLAAGVPGEAPTGGPDQAGVLAVLYGTPSGLGAARSQLWSQDSPGILDGDGKGDRFGFSVATGNFGHGRRRDLLVGVPFEDVAGFIDAGAAAVLYGQSGGLSAQGDQFWNQASSGVPGSIRAGDLFGFGLAQAAGGTRPTTR